MKTLTIDCRLLNKSGIGTYLKNILPVLPRILTNTQIYAIIDKSDPASTNFFENLNFSGVIPAKSKIFSLGEQFEIPRITPSSTNLFWAPHFNIPFRNKKKLLVTIHDIFHLAQKNTIGVTKYYIARLYFDFLIKKADKIITVSKFSASELEKNTKIEPRKIETIYNGIAYPNLKFPLSTKKSDRPFFLYVGNIKPHKNLGRLIDVFTTLLKEIPHNLVIVGETEGFITPDNLSIQKAKAYPNRIFLKGFISDQELYNLYSQADALIFPSLYEGFGFPPLEAMSVGCPVIVSNFASMPEILEDAALYFNPLKNEEIRNIILTFVQNPDVKTEMIKRGKERSAYFPWKKTVEKTTALINSLL